MLNEKKKDLPVRHKQVLSVLRPGKASATTVKEIISLVGGTSVEVRRIVSEMVVKHGIKIAGSNDQDRPGFYIIETEDERKQAIANLASRIKQMATRIQALERDDDDDDQITIDETDEDDDGEDNNTPE